MSSKTRLSLSKEQRQEVFEDAYLVSLTPEKEKELTSSYLWSQLNPYVEEIEGILVCPRIDLRHDFLVVCSPKPESEIFETIEVLFTFKKKLSFEGEDIEVEGKVFKLSKLEENPWIMQIKQEVVHSMVNGEPWSDGWSWEPNTQFCLSSTPTFPPEDPLKVTLEEKVAVKFESLEAQIAELTKVLNTLIPNPIVPKDVGEPKIPQKPDQPDKPSKPKVEVDPNLLEHSKIMVEEMASKGLLSIKAPSIQAQFSGDKLKTDCSFETWEFEILQLLSTHQPGVIKQTITKSLKGGALETLTSLCNLETMTVREILHILRRKYGQASTYDIMMKKLFMCMQKENEMIHQFCTRMECLVRDIFIRFPEKILDKDALMKDRFYNGLKEHYRNKFTHEFKDDSISYVDLISLCREEEAAVESGKYVKEYMSDLIDAFSKDQAPSTSNDNGKKAQTKTAQVKSEVVTSMDPSLSKLCQLAKKCESEQATNIETVKTLQKAFKDYEQRNNSFHIPYDQRQNQGQAQGQGRGRGYYNNPPNYNNPNTRYLGNRYDPNFRGRGGYRGRGRGGPDQSQNYRYYNFDNQPGAQAPPIPNQTVTPVNDQVLQGNSQQSQNRNNNGTQRRQPYCKFCAEKNFPVYDHWPGQCDFIANCVRNWSHEQNQNGHTRQSESLNTSGLS